VGERSESAASSEAHAVQTYALADGIDHLPDAMIGHPTVAPFAALGSVPDHEERIAFVSRSPFVVGDNSGRQIDFHVIVLDKGGRAFTVRLGRTTAIPPRL
jgi:hypothetical protein